MFTSPLRLNRLLTSPIFLLFYLLFAVTLCRQASAQTSTEFWLAPPEVTQGHAGSVPIYVRLAAGADPATVTISQPANPSFHGGTPIVVNLLANQSQTVTLDSLVNVLETRPANTVLNTGLKISSTANITAIYEVSPTNNPDIWALKGSNGLGTEFYTPFQNIWRNGSYTPTPYTSFDIVATQDNTNILIYPTSALDGGQPAYQSFTITLNEGQTYSASVTSTDPALNPTGSQIISDKPIAVSIKDDSVWPEPAGCKDLNGDQIVPVNIVGDEYIVNKGALTVPENAYVVATQNNTVISVAGSPVATLFNGETYKILITDPLVYITGTKPFYLIHQSGFGCETGTALLPPLNCAGSEQVSFVRSTTESFFMNLLVLAGHEDAFVLNGNATIINPSAFAPVPGTGGVWVGAQIQFNTTQIPQGVANLLVNTEEVFSMGLINGGSSSGCRFGYFSEFSAEILVDAGVDQNVCANKITQLAGDISGGATQGVWSSDGTGSFSPDEYALDAIYEPSLADLSGGSVTLTLTSISNCFPVEDEVEINYNPAPIVDAGTDIQACQNNTVVDLDGFIDIASGGLWSGGAGSYNPGPGNLTATYTPTATEVSDGSLKLYLTSTGNGNCFAEKDSVLITFGPSPTANAGIDQTLCANNASTQLNGSVTIAGGGEWSGGTGVFSPSAQSLTPTYIPSNADLIAGSVTLTLTTTDNQGCNPVTDQVVITYTDGPVVDAGSDRTVCENNADVILNGSVSNAGGGIWTGGAGTFNPDAATFNATYTPSLSELLAGSVTLTLKSTGNGTCLEEQDAMTITFTDAPTVNAGADASVCSNNAAIALNGSLTIANFGIWSGGAGTFAPSTTALNATYTPTASEISSGSVTLTLTSLDNGSCSAVSDNVTYTFTPSPTANAGIDQSVCDNNPTVTLSGSISVAGGGAWSGGSGSYSPDNTTMNAVYTPTAGEISSGSLTLTLTTTSNGTCSAVTDQMVITFTDAPTANAGTDKILCSNNADIDLSGVVTVASGGSWSGGLGTYSPDPNTLITTYSPTTTEINSGSLTLTLSTSGNGNCTVVTDNINITFTPAPTAEAGAPISVCSNNAQVGLNGSVTIATGGTWSGGAGTFIPNANTLNALYNPTAAEIATGSLILTLTTTGIGTCNPVQDVVNITFTPPPTANAGSDVTVCGNNPNVDLNGSVNLASGGIWSGGSGSFNPNNTSLGATYTPSNAEITAGTTTLTLTTTGNGTCNQVTDQMTITITPAPTVDAGIGEELCSNNPVISLNGAVTTATGGTWSGGSGTFNPNANALNATYTPSQGEINAGTLTLTLTSTGNGTCTAVTDNVTYTFGPSPTANAGSDQTLCANNAVAALSGSVTIATGGTWSGGNGTFSAANNLNTSYTPTAAEIATGTVTLTLTTTGNGDCLATTDNITLTFTPAPTANAGTDKTVCANNEDVTLNGSVTVANGGTWSGGNGSFNPDANTLNAVYTPSATEISNGTVTLTLTTTGNGTCNQVTDQMTITITPAPTVDAGTGEELCSNNAVISLSGAVTTATGGTWSGGSGTFNPNANDLNATYTPSQGEINAGTLTLTLTSTGNGTCTAITDDVTYTFGPSPTADAGSDQTLCGNNAVATLSGSVTIATGGSWSGGNGTFSAANNLNTSYTPTAAEIAAGTVTLTLTTTGNGDCLATTDNITLTFTPAPTANAGTDKTVCANNAEVTLNGSVTVATSGSWSGGSGTFDPDENTLNAIYSPSATEISNGTVTLTLTTTGNGTCIQVTDQMTITITPEPTVNAGTGEELCSNNAVISLSGSVTTATGGTWSGGSGTFNPNASVLNATYTPSQGEINAGTLTLTLTSTGNGTCNAVTDDVTYTFGPSPTVNAGIDQTLCGNNAVASLSGAVTIATGGTWSGGNGTFSAANNLNTTYTPTAAEITAGTVSLTLTTTGNGDCLEVTDNITLTFTPAPTVNAGLDKTVCANNADLTLNGAVTVASGGTWSGGTGTFNPDANTLNAVYSPSATEISNGTVTLTLTTTGNGTCNQVTDQITITITPQPTVDAGTGEELCANNAQITLDGLVTVASGATWSGGTGTFNPNANDLNATYTPSQGEINAGILTLTLTSSGNGTCTAVTDDVTYTFGPSPTADAGSDQTLCANNAEAELNGTVTIATGGTWSGGDGNFSPSVNSLNAFYTPTPEEIAAGTVTLSLTTTGNGNCLAVTDNITITFTPAPTANAGLDKTVCANNADVTLNGAVTVAAGATWSGGSGTFNPDANTLNAVYSPSATEISNGTVTLTLTTTGNGTCNQVTDQMTITITPEPTVNAGTSEELCSNNAAISLNGSVTVATGGTWSGGNGTYNPNANTLNAVYTPSQSEINAGILTLTLTATGIGNCSAVTDVVTYTFGPSPTVDAGTPITVCSNNSQVSLDGTITFASGGTWSGGNGTFFPNANTIDALYNPTATEIASGSLVLTLTTTGNGNCNPEQDVVTITFSPSPSVSAGSDQTVCANNAEVDLNGSINLATGAVWSGGSGTFSPNNTALGATYTPSNAELANGTVTLTLTTTGNGNCLAATDQMTITITPAPTVDAGTGEELCSNNPTISLGGSVTTATGGTWSGGSGTFNPNANALNATYTPSLGEVNAGTLTLTLTSAGNGLCTAVTDNVTFTFGPSPTADAGIDQTLCANNAVASLSGSVSIATGGTWSGGNGSFSSANNLNTNYTPTAAEIAAGTVTLTLTTTGNGDCLATTDNITLTFTPAPTANAGLDKTVCANNVDVTLNGSVTVASGGTWSGGSGTFNPDANTLNAVYTPSATEIANGTVTLTLTTTGNGICNQVTDQMTITITPEPTVDAGTGEELCSNNPVISLSGSVTTATGGTWSGGSGTFNPNANALNATYTPSQGEINAGTLTLTLSSTGNGTCTAVTDDVTYTFGPSPTADAGIDQTLCANNAEAELNGSVTIATGGTWSGGDGNFSPSVNSLNAFYTPTPEEITAGTVTLTLTTTGNGDCLAVTDNITITFTPAPTANAGVDKTVCANNADVTLNGSVTVATGGTWSGGSGSFNPDANTLNSIYSPSATEISNGTVTLTLTTTGNGTCNQVTDQMTITITPEPTVDAGTGEELCSNNAAISLSGSVTTATGGTWSGGSGTFNPNANALNATYTPSQGEINAGTLTLTLTSTGNGTCTAVTDDVTYTFGPSPTADAGIDQTLCGNNAVASLSGVVTIATGGTWSGGGGTFSAVNNLNTNYTPTAAEITAGAATLTLTTTGNGDCLAVTDNITLTFTPAPTVNAGLDKTVCANNADITLNGAVTVASGGTWSGGTGTFNPDANTLNAIYSPSATEISNGTVTLTLTTTGNGTCNQVTDQMTIIITPQPTVDAGTGEELCANNAQITLDGSVTVASGATWSGGSGTFNPNANDLNATYTPSQGEINAGILTLTLTSTGNGTCAPVTDDVSYTFTPSPTADAGANMLVCANNADIQLAGAVTVASGGTWSGGNGTYSPNANTLDAIYSPSPQEIADGSLTLTLTTTGNNNCNPVSDDITISFSPAPTANAGTDKTVCANNAEVNLNGSVSIATGGIWSGGSGTFDPSVNVLNPIYTPSAVEIAAGQAVLTLTTTGNGDCTAESDQIIITINPEPIVSAGADFAACSNNAEFDLNGSVSNAGGGQWTGGLGTFDPNNNTLDAHYTPTLPEIVAGSVNLTLTSTGNSGCIAVTDNLVVTFTPSPTVDAGTNITLCASSPQATLNGSFSVSGGAQWSGGNGSFSPNALTMNANYNPTAAEVASGSVTLTLTTISNGDCLAEVDSVLIQYDAQPTVNAGANLISCANNPVVALNGSFTNADGVEWNGGTGFFDPSNESPNANYTPSNGEVANGFVTLTLTTTGSGACADVDDDVNVTINPAPIVSAGVDQTVCANNNNVQLNGSIQFAGGGQWSGGSGIFTPNANALSATYQPSATELSTGFVTLTLTSVGNGSCNAVTDQITITFTPSPIADAGLDVTACENNADVQLNGSYTVAEGANWSGGSGSFSPDNSTMNAVYTPSQTELNNGTVTLNLTTFGNGNCLPSSDQIVLNFTPAPVIDAGDDYFVCVSDLTVPLQGSVTGPTTSGIWTTSGTGVFVPNASALNGTYQVSSADSLAGEITLTLTSTGNGLCTPETDEILVHISPAGTASAGADQSICSNNPTVSVVGVIGGAATSGTWITSGSGVFSPNPNQPAVNYIPSDEDIANGNVTLTFAVNSCNQASDDLVITFTPSPVVAAGADATICSSETGIQLSGSVSGASATGTWTTSGSGQFLPNANVVNPVYEFSEADKDDQVITLTLNASNIGNCIGVSDALVLNIFPEGTANAGQDVTACDNNPEIQLEGILTGADQALWSTSGSGTFAPSADTLSTTYVPSQADLDNGAVDLILTGVNSCNNATDFMHVTYTEGPTVDAGADQSACGDVIPFQIMGAFTNAGGAHWSTLGTGTFQNANNINTFYVASQADIDQGGVDLVLTTTGNGNCFPVSDTLTLFISTGITVDAGADRVACVDAGQIQLFGDIANGSNSGMWTTSGNGTFNPTPNNVNAVYQFTAEDITAGNVTLTLTSTNNGICNEVSDSFELTFGNAAFVFAGNDINVCETNDLIEINGIVSGETSEGTWTTTGDGTFFPDANTLSAFYEPGTNDIANGSADLTLTSTGNTLCSEGSSTLTINLQPVPVAQAGDDQVVCGEISGVQLLGSANGSAGGIWTTNGSGTFQPSDSVLTALYTPSMADSLNGDITLTLTTYGNGSCGADTDEMIISFSGAVTANAGPDQAICENTTSIALNGSVEGSPAYEWGSLGTGTFDPSAANLSTAYLPSTGDVDNGAVTLFLMAAGTGNCPEQTDSLYVTFDPLPVINVASDVESCVTQSEVALTANVTGSNSVLWTSQGGGSFNPNATTANVTYTPTPAEIAAGNANISLTANSNGACGSVQEPVTIHFRQLATVFAGNAIVACETDGQVPLNGTVSGEGYGAQWSTNAFGSFAPDATQPDADYVFAANDILIGSAKLILSSSNNGACPAVTDTVLVEINRQPVVDAGEDDFVCKSAGMVSLNGTVANEESVQWSSLGDGVFLPSNTEVDPEYVIGNIDGSNGSVQLVLTGMPAEGCSAVKDTVTININNPLEAGFSSGPGCIGTPVEFTDETQVFAGSIASWRWDFGNGNISNQQNPQFVFSQAGTPSVQLVVQSSLGCNDTIVQLVNVVQGPEASFDVSKNPAPINFDIDFKSTSQGASSYSWNMGDGLGFYQSQNLTYQYPDEGEYVVTLLVNGEGGCVDSASTTVTIEGFLVLPPRLPNTFSPNDDGLNDVYFVRGGPFIELDFRVYDAWGSEIFKTTDQSVGWDGTEGGKQSPVGVYVYTVKATNLNGEQYDYSGRINLLR